MATLAAIATAITPASPKNDLARANFSPHLLISESSLALFIICLMAVIGVERQLGPSRLWTLVAMALLFALPVGLTLFEKGLDRLFRIVAANTRNLQRRFLGYRIPQVVRCTKGERLFA